MVPATLLIIPVACLHHAAIGSPGEHLLRMQMGLLPLATTTYAVMRERVHPPVQFWLSRLAGMMAVVLFVLSEGMGHVQGGDGWMLLAAGTGAVGYAEGGRLARELGGWRVICWALVFAAPFLIVPTSGRRRSLSPGKGVLRFKAHTRAPCSKRL
ncbi:MAG TPA: hypothetical protein VFV38_02220 [Ktedonobacteraceae bacterium]|nr:hypothetical protein [Ktedonobacteraceae bacterium]